MFLSSILEFHVVISGLGSWVHERPAYYSKYKSNIRRLLVNNLVNQFNRVSTPGIIHDTTIHDTRDLLNKVITKNYKILY